MSQQKRKTNKEIPVKVLLLNLPEKAEQGQAVRRILAELEIETVTVGRDQGQETIGFLMGLSAFSSSAAEPVLIEEEAPLMVMSGMTDALLGQLLTALKEGGVRIPYKAVVTENNVNWPLGELFAEIRSEHALMREVSALDKLIREGATLRPEGREPLAWLRFQALLQQAAQMLRQDAPYGIEDYRGAVAALTAAYEALTGDRAEKNGL